MKDRLAVILGLFVVASIARASDGSPFAAEFTKEALRTWCAVGRSDEEVKKEFGANPMVFGSFESVPGFDEQYFVDVIRFTYPIEEREDGGLRRVQAMKLESPVLTFRFLDHALIEVFVFRPLSDHPNEFIWQKKNTEQNQPVQSNSVDAPRSPGGALSISRSPRSA